MSNATYCRFWTGLEQDRPSVATMMGWPALALLVSLVVFFPRLCPVSTASPSVGITSRHHLTRCHRIYRSRLTLTVPFYFYLATL